MELKNGQSMSEEVIWPDILTKAVPNAALIHEVISAYQANARQGTHSTKTRGEVRGGGRKPWKQKHTGRARQGSIRSPLHRKGGVTFGPKPRSYKTNVGQEKRRQALIMALAAKLQQEVLGVISEENFRGIAKTKDLAQIVKRNIGVDSNALFVVAAAPADLRRASRNLQGICFALSSAVNARDVLAANRVVLTDKALESLTKERLSGD